MRERDIVCVCVCVYVCLREGLCMCLLVCIWMCVCVCVCMYACVFVPQFVSMCMKHIILLDLQDVKSKGRFLSSEQMLNIKS